jgi:hypothetical protein
MTKRGSGQEIEPLCYDLDSSIESVPSLSSSRLISARTEPGHVDPTASLGVHTLRSATAMQGLLLAEVGDSMVQLNIGGSGFREGQRIALGDTESEGVTKHLNQSSYPTSHTAANLARHGTLLSVGVTPSRNAAELKSILGNTSARLKPGAALLPFDKSAFKADSVALEQAKPRTRIEIDIVLESGTCVQGSYLKGLLKIRVRRHPKKETAIFVADGKVRVVGFECIPHEDDRHTFYQCSAPLSAITDGLDGLYNAGPDEEGFREAKEGVHILKFALPLPLEGTTTGDAKGVIHVHSGVRIRYITIACVPSLATSSYL